MNPPFILIKIFFDENVLLSACNSLVIKFVSGRTNVPSFSIILFAKKVDPDLESDKIKKIFIFH